MKLIRTAEEMRAWSRTEHQKGMSIGFVPTMGYLHDAHLSLVDLARKHADSAIVSIFVNPAQFGPGEDFTTYPRDEARDLQLCRDRGVDGVWLPQAEEMYPEGYATWVNVEGLDQHLCGASRPGHFRGVTTVVSKLFHVVQPDVAVFGRKDAQQARIIQRMTADLQFGVRIVLGDTLREKDGLAMSSRNVRLTPAHRTQALALFQALNRTSAGFRSGERSAERLFELTRASVQSNAPDGRIDYIELVDWETLQPVEMVTRPALLALAVWFGKVRLIDNVVLEP